MKDPNEGTPDQSETSEEVVEEREINFDNFPADTSGFEEENDDEHGEIKIEKPESEGLDAAISGLDQFVDAKDGQAPEIDTSFHDAFPKDTSGFEEDADLSVDFEDGSYVGPSDPTTAPAYNEEEEVFTEEEPKDPEVIGSNQVTEEEPEEPSEVELASDSDMEDLGEVEESATGWDDIF